MQFTFLGALVAGFAATLVMSVMMKMAGRAGMTYMPPMELVTGSMLTGEPDKAKQYGLVLHWLMMGTVVFGVGYAVVFNVLDSAGWLTGVAVGAVHGLVLGAVFMPMMPAMHPRMSSERFLEGPVRTGGGTVTLAAPGLFGARWGGMTPVGLVMGHVVYGLVAALVYQRFL